MKQANANQPLSAADFTGLAACRSSVEYRDRQVEEEGRGVSKSGELPSAQRASGP